MLTTKSSAATAACLVQISGSCHGHTEHPHLLHGTELNPIGNGDISLTKVIAYSEPISCIQTKFDGTGDEAHADITAQFPAGSLKSSVTVRPKEGTYTAQLTSSGIDLTKLEAPKTKSIEATGVAAISAHGQGSVDNPKLNASIQIPMLAVKRSGGTPGRRSKR
jgi:translocation and assembly module TamB